MDLRTEQRDQNHSGKEAWLQSRWQEVSERERRAKVHNRKLLQDFQRAQDTLTDLVARTEAMNTIRVEYERYVEQNFPRWQQKLKDKRLLEQLKRIKEHLKACIQQMEEDHRMKRAKTSSIRTHSPSSISSDPSHPPISHPIPLSRECKEKRGEVPARKVKSTLSKQDNKQNLQGIIPNDSQPLYVPFTCPSETEPQQSINLKQSKTFQNIHQALNSPITLLADPRYGPYPVIQQEQPSSDHFPQHLKAWAGGVQSAPAGAPWMGVAVNPLLWKMLKMYEADAEEVRYSEESEGEKWRKDSNSEVQKLQEQRRRRKDKGSERSSELDTKSASLSDVRGDNSESSALSLGSANVLRSSRIDRTRNPRRKETQIYRSSSGEKGVVPGGSSFRSHHHSDTNNEKSEISQTSTATKTTFKTRFKASNTQMKNTAGVETPKHQEKEQEGNSKEDRITDSPTTVEKKKNKRNINIKKTKKGIKRNEDESVEEKPLTDQEERVSEDGVESKEREEEEGEEQDEEVKSEGLCKKKKRNGGGGSAGASLVEMEVEEEEDDYEGRENDEEKVGGYKEEEEDDGGEDEDEDDGGDKEEEENSEEQYEEVKREELCKKKRRKKKSEAASLVEIEGEEEGDGGEDEDEDGGGDKKEAEDDANEELMKKDEGKEDDDQEDGEDADGGENGEEDGTEEMSVEVRSPRNGQIKGGDESDDRGNDSEVAASDSRVNMHDSLKDLNKDEETEDEDLYDQEIEDDIGDDEDDDDVVVEKAYPWSRGPVYNHTKYQDDEDEDEVEGLLAPQINIQQQQRVFS